MGYKSVIGAICINCKTIYLYITKDSIDFIGTQAECSAIRDGDYTCDSPMAELADEEIMELFASFKVTVAGQGS